MKLIVATAIPFLSVAGCIEQPPPSMTVGAAETYCGPLAERYARRAFPVFENGTTQIGLQAETPDDFMVQDYYRRCVFAKSGQRPSGRLEWRL
jgi:hypothetical protein